MDQTETTEVTFEDAFSVMYRELLEKDVDHMTEMIMRMIGGSRTRPTPFSIYRNLGILIEFTETGRITPTANLYRAVCNLLIFTRSDNFAFDKFSRMVPQELARFLARCSLLNLSGEQFERAVREEINK